MQASQSSPYTKRLASQQAAFSFSKMGKRYPPDQIALSDISLSVSEGEFVFIAGSSGAGKSTMLKILLGAERISDGEGLVLGRNLRFLSRSQLPELRSEIGVIFQDYKLLSSRTVIDNVAFSLEMQGIDRQKREALAYKLLAALGLRNKVHAFPQVLSGGEQQRVAVARALITRPKLILADEPTGNLDPDMTYAVISLLLEANRCGATVIVASHNIPLIEELNKRTLVLDQGKLVGDFAQVRG
ncbi:MAG TPA: ATP-binding cassette domain-containing protein [Oligoflexia bacterium]|nr:ATP-binding cassette domain-containing protein [Oligoflexia bacterium]HMP48855.1 ATP-binding cassette domain-containing protein [Oligoflexia bacterium]